MLPADQIIDTAKEFTVGVKSLMETAIEYDGGFLPTMAPGPTDNPTEQPTTGGGAIK